MNDEIIKIRGAKTHNLKNIDLDIPQNKIICLWGPSGCGKSSLAFHTLLAESRRRYLNSLPSDMKFFWSMPQSADVDTIYPVLPVWGLAQQNPVLGSRPNFSDLTGVFEPLQKLFYYFGEHTCPTHRIPLKKQSLLDDIQNQMIKCKDKEVAHLVVKTEDYRLLFKAALPTKSINYKNLKVRNFHEEDNFSVLLRFKIKNWNKQKEKIKQFNFEGVSLGLCYGEGDNIKWIVDPRSLKCESCDYTRKLYLSMEELNPYNAAGACLDCSGHGMILFYDKKKLVKYPYLSINDGAISILNYSKFKSFLPILKKELRNRKISLTKTFDQIENDELWDIILNGMGKFPGVNTLLDYLESKRYKTNVRIFLRTIKSEKICHQCSGRRVQDYSQSLTINHGRLSFYEALGFTLTELESYLKVIKSTVQSPKMKKNITKLISLCKTGINLGIGSVDQTMKAKKLSTSEYQRALLTKILSFEGGGSLFILDEPTLDLTLEEQVRLLGVLKKLRDQGNTIIIIEHSEYFKGNSDYLIEMGPGAGDQGGTVIRNGIVRSSYNFPKLKSKQVYTGKAGIAFPSFKVNEVKIRKGVIAKGAISLVRGELIREKKEYLYEHLANTLYFNTTGKPLYRYENLIDGCNLEDEVESVFVFEPRLKKLGSRSTVGTMSGLSPEVRKHLINLPVSKSLLLEKGHFSPNSDLGKCTSCEGKGVLTIDMSFMEDMKIPCEDCSGMKLKPVYANIFDGEYTAYDYFHQPMSEVLPKIRLTPKFQRIWDYMKRLSLDYLSLDREVSGLSGGERQRLSILSEVKSNACNQLMIFENLSFGLGVPEIDGLFQFLNTLKKLGNYIVIVDQNPLLIDRVDYLLLE